MSLTRNDACVLEHQGSFDQVNAFGRGDHAMATVIGPIETRVFFMRMNTVDTARVVKKPTEDGIVTAVELFDAQRNLITQFFGLRKPGVRNAASGQIW